VRRYQHSVFAVCYRLLGERAAAEDQAQEAFIRAFQRLATFDDSRPFGPWMRRLAANLCLNHLETRRLAQVPLDDELDAGHLPAPASDPVISRERAEQSAALQAALLSLPPRYRAVIELRHFQELSYAEIASALGLPVSDVKSHLFRARKLLAQRLDPDLQ
jgi:RNA polymerase sigma-70 factor (ECF subfamily)